MLAEPLWFYFGHLGVSGATGALSCATFFLVLVSPGDKRDLPRLGHRVPMGVVEGDLRPMGTELFLVRCFWWGGPLPVPPSCLVTQSWPRNRGS